AAIADRPLPPGTLLGDVAVADLLKSGRPLRVDVIFDSLPAGLTPILRIRNDAGVDLVTLAAADTALTVQLRTRAADVRLDSPERRSERALSAPRPGDQVRIRFWSSGRNYCIEAGVERDCSPAFTVGDTWGLIVYPRTMAGSTRRVVGLAWLAFLAAAVGFTARRNVTLVVLLVGLTGILLVAPRFAGIAPTPSDQLIASVTFLVVGSVAGRWFNRGIGTARPAPPPSIHHNV